MARWSRLAPPHIAMHITQRRNDRQCTFTDAGGPQRSELQHEPRLAFARERRTEEGRLGVMSRERLSRVRGRSGLSTKRSCFVTQGCSSNASVCRRHQKCAITPLHKHGPFTAG